jgi:sialic acid synthase SpsE
MSENDAIKLENLKFLKPLSGIPANSYHQILNKKINKNLPKGGAIRWEDIDNEA